jgi:hypothetical protein
MKKTIKSLTCKLLAFVVVTGIAGLAAALVGLNPAVAGSVVAVAVFSS